MIFPYAIAKNMYVPALTLIAAKIAEFNANPVATVVTEPSVAVSMFVAFISKYGSVNVVMPRAVS
jgi:hypothetical protein